MKIKFKLQFDNYIHLNFANHKFELVIYDNTNRQLCFFTFTFYIAGNNVIYYKNNILKKFIDNFNTLYNNLELKETSDFFRKHIDNHTIFYELQFNNFNSKIKEIFKLYNNLLKELFNYNKFFNKTFKINIEIYDFTKEKILQKIYKLFNENIISCL